jgi:hypothetical protein
MQDQGSVQRPKGIFAFTSTPFGLQVEIRFRDAPGPFAQANSSPEFRQISLPMDSL